MSLPTQVKIELINRLSEAGFANIESASSSRAGNALATRKGI